MLSAVTSRSGYMLAAHVCQNILEACVLRLIAALYLGKYSLTTSSFCPCMRYVQEVCGGYQWATDRKMPSESPEAARSSLVSTQSHVPFLLPAVSTCPGQFPTLKWKPVLRSGPANELTNSTNRSWLVPIIEYGNLPIPQNVPVFSWKKNEVIHVAYNSRHRLRKMLSAKTCWIKYQTMKPMFFTR